MYVLIILDIREIQTLFMIGHQNHVLKLVLPNYNKKLNS